MSGPNSSYDLQAALEALSPGYVIQREMLDAAAATYAANNYAPLTQVQAQAACLAGAQTIETEFDDDVLGVLIPPAADPYPDVLPPVFVPPLGYTLNMPRFPDSNEDPFDGWVKFGPWQQGAMP